MGYERHHGIIVSTFTEERAHKAHKTAKDIFAGDVSEILKSRVNGIYSFFIQPDGSKEGWDESDFADARRDQFLKWLEKQAFDDMSNPYDYVEVQYGDDNLETIVVRDSDERRRACRESG